MLNINVFAYVIIIIVIVFINSNFTYFNRYGKKVYMWVVRNLEYNRTNVHKKVIIQKNRALNIHIIV